MDCPRCGGALDRYTCGDHEAAVCPDCGWAGVPADHRADVRPPETWTEALRRFHEGDRKEISAETLAEVAAAMDDEADTGAENRETEEV